MITDVFMSLPISIFSELTRGRNSLPTTALIPCGDEGFGRTRGAGIERRTETAAMRSPSRHRFMEGRPLRAIVLLASTLLLAGADLPVHGPIPQSRPDAGPDAPKTPITAPEAKAGSPAPGAAARPDSAVSPSAPEAEAPPIETEDPAAFTRCSAALTALGAEFSEIERIDDGGGCGIDRPLLVKSLGAGVSLTPPGQMRCQTALNLSRWTQDVVLPFAKKPVRRKLLPRSTKPPPMCVAIAIRRRMARSPNTRMEARWI
nr:extensin family protein [Rhizobium sp. G21]